MAIRLVPSPVRAGFYKCVLAPGDQKLVPVLSKIPGVQTVPGGFWIVPFDRVVRTVAEARRLGLDVAPIYAPAFLPIDGLPHPKLYPYQNEAAFQAARQRRLMINFKPGLGKTPTAIQALKLAKVSRALIVAPAIVRDTWGQEFAKWWPKAAHEVQIVESGREAQNAKAPFVVASYELMSKVAPQTWDAVIFDEAHYFKTAGAKRCMEAAAFLAAVHKDTLRLFLTGTPIANEPIDLHNQVELLYPGLWGTIHECKRAYCESRENPHSQSGLEWFGLNKERAAELAERLACFAASATEEKVAHHLPPITFQTVRVKPERAFNVREYLDNFDRRDLHASRGADAAIRACGQAKIEHTVALVEEALHCGSTHVAVMTHLRNTAAELADTLAATGVPVGLITGDDPHKRRHNEISRLAKLPKAIFVATMHSVGVGINELIAFPDVVYAELDYRPDEVAQSMKRYRRLTGKKHVRIRVLVLEGTLEERVAASIARKLHDQEMVVDIGTDAGSLLSTLDHKLSDDEFFARVQEAAAKMGERDVYA